jgi:hypothetical protein
MRRILMVVGVLGSGTALSFAAAGAILLASPEGRLVANEYQGQVAVMKGVGAPQPMPVPLPLPAQGVVVDDTGNALAPPVNRVIKLQGKAFVVPAPAETAVPVDGATAP